MKTLTFDQALIVAIATALAIKPTVELTVLGSVIIVSFKLFDLFHVKQSDAFNAKLQALEDRINSATLRR